VFCVILKANLNYDKKANNVKQAMYQLIYKYIKHPALYYMCVWYNTTVIMYCNILYKYYNIFEIITMFLFLFIKYVPLKNLYFHDFVDGFIRKFIL